jgi:hypothetical protein
MFGILDYSVFLGMQMFLFKIFLILSLKTWRKYVLHIKKSEKHENRMEFS